MSRCLVFLTCVALLALVGGVSGCGAPPPGSPSNGAGAGHEPADAPEAAQASDELEQALAQLPEADRQAARQQAVCPVSGEKLGSMGMPYKVAINGREVFLCCQGCEAELKASPEKYLK